MYTHSLVNIIDDSFNWAWSEASASEIVVIISVMFPKYIKEEIWDALTLSTMSSIPPIPLFDSIVQLMLDNQLGGKREAVRASRRVLPGFDVDLETADGYRMLEEAIYCASTSM